MTFFLNAIIDLRHPEERPIGRVSKDAKCFCHAVFLQAPHDFAGGDARIFPPAVITLSGTAGGAANEKASGG
jgi:hypothetical protein